MRLLLLLLCLGLCNCRNIAHKSFRASSHGAGLKMTLNDPIGTGSPLPEVICGFMSSSVTTIPPGVDIDYTTETFTPFFGTPLLKEHLIIKNIDSTLKVTEHTIESKTDVEEK